MGSTDDSPARSAKPAPPRPAGWALGLPALALVAIVAAMRVAPAIEINIRREASRLVRAEPDSPLTRDGARIAVTGRDVRIVTDAELPEPVEDAVRRRIAAVPAVRAVAREVTGYVLLSPYVFRVRRTESALELSGGVPSADLRTRLVAEAGQIVPPDQVEDRLRLAAGAPDGFAPAASLLLATIGPVPAGDASLSGNRLQANGNPADPVSYNRLLAALRNLPKGYVAGEIDILPPRISPFVWTARRDDGGIALGGAVPSEEKRAALIRLAEEVLPGLPVRDAMQTARGLDRSIDFLDAARAGLDSLARLRTGESQIADRRFTLTGETIAKGGVAAVERRLRETLPSALGAPMVTLAVVPAAPFLFSARREAGRIELAGYVSDERDRAIAAGVAAARFPGERLVDRLIAVEGAPAGFSDVLRTALETLSDFAEGEATVKDRDLAYSGRVLYGQLAARIRRTAPRQVPEGWRASVELEPVRPAGALDAHLCSDLLSDAARRNPIRFIPGQSAPDPKAGPALEAAADILRRCGRVGIRIVHHLGAGPDAAAARDLAADRARALMTALSERGATARFSVGGALAPGADRDGDRTEFQVAPL